MYEAITASDPVLFAGEIRRAPPENAAAIFGPNARTAATIVQTSVGIPVLFVNARRVPERSVDLVELWARRVVARAVWDTVIDGNGLVSLDVDDLRGFPDLFGPDD